MASFPYQVGSHQLLNAINPVWFDAEHTSINLTIRISLVPNEDIPFLANPNDVEVHGREIFALAAAGEFGTVAEFNS